MDLQKIDWEVARKIGLVPASSSAFQTLDDWYRAIQGGQIKFPATQNPSSDPNTLDDYEEGTWTPSVGGTATYTKQIAFYIKIGRYVFSRFDIIINVIGTGSTSVISGLPYAVDGTYYGGGSLSYFANLTTSVIYLVPEPVIGSSTFKLNGTTAAAGSITTPINVLGNGSGLSGVIHYIASA